MGSVVLEGASVRLRRLEREDLPLLHRWLNDRELMTWARFSPDHMVTLAALEKDYEEELTGKDPGRVSYIVEERREGRPIGWCVAWTRDRKHLNANVGVALGDPGLWGKGYGTEALRLLLTILFDHQGWHRAELWTLAENERAVRSFEKVGFRREGVAREAAYFGGRHLDVVLMGLLRAEWNERREARSEDGEEPAATSQ